MQKRVLISIPEKLNDRWGEVAKKHGISKSGMVEEFLNEVIPVLEEEVPSKILASAMKRMAKEMDTTSTLFDSISSK